MFKSLLVTLLTAAVVTAAPKITGPTTVPRDTLVRLSADGVNPDAGLMWRVYPSDKVSRATTDEGILEFVAPPGVYEVELLEVQLLEGRKVKLLETRVKVTVTGGSSPPTPPNPLPPDEPPDALPDPVKATGRILFGSAGCTATVIEKQRDGRWLVLTAAHCISGVGAKGVLYLRDGRSMNVTCVTREAGSDLAWLVTNEPQTNMPFAKLATELPASGTDIWHNGYGIDKPSNREDGRVSGIANDNQIEMILNVSSGDSGGGIFRSDNGELVSVVCCTTDKGQRVRMFGGSSVRAAQLKPKQTDVDEMIRILPFLDLSK